MKISQEGAEIYKKCAVLKLAQGCYPSFQWSHQKNPCYRSLVKILQKGAKIFNKTCSFAVNIGLLPSF